MCLGAFASCSAAFCAASRLRSSASYFSNFTLILLSCTILPLAVAVSAIIGNNFNQSSTPPPPPPPPPPPTTTTTTTISTTITTTTTTTYQTYTIAAVNSSVKSFSILRTASLCVARSGVCPQSQSLAPISPSRSRPTPASPNYSHHERHNIDLYM